MNQATNNPLFRPLYLPRADKGPEINPTFAQTMASAFNLENDVVNIYDLISRPVFEPNAAFDFQAEFKAQQLPLDWMVPLSRAQSKAEFDSIRGRVGKEYQDKAVLAASGWTGTVAAIGAGIISPTTFIPFSGPAKGGKAIAQMLGLAAAGSTVQNAALFLNQETRTEAELYTGIAMDTALMGMMGGAYLGLSKAGKAQLAGDIKFNEKRVTLPVDPLSRSEAPEVKVRVDAPDPAEVKRIVREENIRNPDEVADLVEEAGEAPVLLKDKALAIGPMKRTTTKDIAVQMAFGKSFLEAPVADGITARFTKATSGTKYFVGGEYSITLHRADGTEIYIPQNKVDTPTRAGNTLIEREAELKEALASGRLDDQLYDMLEAADEPGMVVNRELEAIQSGSSADARSVGAAAVRTRNTLGTKAAGGKIRQAAMKVLGRLHPTYRMQNQRYSPALRDGAYKLDSAGLRQGGLERQEPSAYGGAIVERMRGYDSNIVNFTIDMDRNFYRYLFGKELENQSFSGVRSAVAQLKSQFGPAIPGKLNWSDYKAAVFDGLNTGKFESELADSIASFKKFFAEYNNRHKQYLEEFAARGMDVKPLYKELQGEDELGEGITDYAAHYYDQNVLMEKMSEFIEQFAASNERSLIEAFGKAKERYTKRRRNLEFENTVAALQQPELEARLADTESDLEFLEQLPEFQNMRNARLELTQQAREEGWPEAQLKAEQKALRENASTNLKAIMEERKGLMATARTLRKFGGDATEKVAKLQDEVAKADGRISEMFRQELPKIVSADLSIGRVQAQGDRNLAPVTAGLKKLITSLKARNAKLSDLMTSKRSASLSRNKVRGQIEALEAKYAAMLERLAAVQGKQVGLDEQLRELHLLREDAIADANLLVRSRAARAEELEDKLEVAKAKPLTPDEQRRMTAQIQEELDQLEDNFQAQWAKRGDQSGDPLLAETPDFKERAIELATLLHQRLTNSEVSLSPAYKKLRQDARGSELLRVLKIPYEQKKKWLVNDIEIVARAHDRTFAPDLEIWRAFEGNVNAENLIAEMQQETSEHLARIATAKFVRLPKGWVDKAKKFHEKVAKRLVEAGEAEDLYLEPKNFSDAGGEGFVELTPELRTQLGRAVNDALANNTNDLDIAIQRLRSTRGVPENPDGLMYRTGKVFKDLNVATMMGGVVTASLSDLARPIQKHGLNKVYKHGWAPFINQLNPQAKAFKVRSHEIARQLSVNIEPMLHGRAQALFDLADGTMAKTRLERGVNFAAGKMGIVAMFDYWTAGMKTISSNVSHAVLMEYIPAVARAGRGVEVERLAKGLETEAEFNLRYQAAQRANGASEDIIAMRSHLRDLGLRDFDIQRIATQMERPDGVENFSNGGRLPNIDRWDDPAAYQAYQAAVLTDVNRMIITPGLEKPNWVDENIAYSLVAQFKSFVFASNSRVVMSSLQGNDPYLMQGITFSLAFGALSYYTYALTAGGKTLETANEMDPDKWMWEAVKRSGILGALSLGTDTLSQIPAVTGSDTNMMFRSPNGLLGTLLGPTAAQALKMSEFITKMDSDDPRQQERNMRILRQVWVPYQNVFYLRQLLDRAAESMFGG